MAIRDLGEKTISKTIENGRKVREYRADYLSDIPNLPSWNGTNEDSECFCYENKRAYFLTPEGWV